MNSSNQLHSKIWTKLKQLFLISSSSILLIYLSPIVLNHMFTIQSILFYSDEFKS